MKKWQFAAKVDETATDSAMKLMIRLKELTSHECVTVNHFRNVSPLFHFELVD
jgi:hypothetical protein